jgi:hypothetical protein
MFSRQCVVLIVILCTYTMAFDDVTVLRGDTPLFDQVIVPGTSKLYQLEALLPFSAYEIRISYEATVCFSSRFRANGH